MKPPGRPRLVPSRFAEAPQGPGRGSGRPWGQREKRALLAALRAREAPLGPLEALPLRALRERLPRRSEAEIRAFLVRLRGRAAREALTAKFGTCLRLQRRLRAPIEVWQELAQTLGGGLEGATGAAFSQVLTVAATEPLTLQHSPPLPPPLETPPDPPGDLRTPPDPFPALGPPPSSGTPPNPGPFSVDFRKVYEFLARLAGGAEGPPLSPPEAAVLVSLLGALPAELGVLEQLRGLQSHFRGVFGALMTPQNPGGPPQDPPKTSWVGVGLCPLNLFLVPLRALGRAG